MVRICIGVKGEEDIVKAMSSVRDIVAAIHKEAKVRSCLVFHLKAYTQTFCLRYGSWLVIKPVAASKTYLLPDDCFSWHDTLSSNTEEVFVDPIV